jgi:hypothetical protein
MAPYSRCFWDFEMAVCKVVRFFAVVFLGVAVSRGLAQTYYVSPNGSDSNSGTIDQPWKTFKFAQGRLAAGDTLYLRGGTYFEGSTVSITRPGDSSAWITIQSYPGEHAVISGAIPTYMAAPNTAWTLVDPGINLYKTTNPIGITQQSTYYPGVWLVNDDIRILQYQTRTNSSKVTVDGYVCLSSTTYTTNGMNPFYNGPGTFLDSSGYLYIRLEPNPTDLTDSAGNPIAPVPSTYDPGQIPIAIWKFNTLIELRSPAKYIHFKDLTFAHAGYIIDAYNGTSNIEFDHCSIKFGSYGIIIRTNAPIAHDWYIHDCSLTNGVPDWICWPDCKEDDNPRQAYNEFQSDSFSPEAITNSVIERNLFYNLWDGMTIKSKSQNVIIRRNIFKYSKDDAMNIYEDTNNIEVAYNMFWRTASGIACLGVATPSISRGPIYLHHNIIDNSHLLRLGRATCADYRWANKRWTTLDPFGSHDDYNKPAMWRFYNNTIITRNDNIYNPPAGPSVVGGSTEKYVCNNIFYSKDSRTIFKGESVTEGSHLDGNVMYQVGTSNKLLVDYGDGASDYLHLADYRTANPSSPWEVHGLEADPQFDFEAIDDPNFDPNTIWERYRPANPQMYTQGASYTGLDWPDTQYVNYRGAIPPEGANLDDTGSVDFADFAIFAKHWLDADCFAPLYCQGADINKHDGVDVQDLYEFTAGWLSSN